MSTVRPPYASGRRGGMPQAIMTLAKVRGTTLVEEESTRLSGPSRKSMFRHASKKVEERSELEPLGTYWYIKKMDWSPPRVVKVPFVHVPNADGTKKQFF